MTDNDKQKNRFGLSRYIPADVRRRIRAEAGYGCVLCGSIFIHYEHIEPEFKDAERHDPDRMTLLCGGCHDRVTRGIISKRRVWEGKRNPKARQDGYLKERLFCETREQKLRIGDCTFGFDSIGLALSGMPVFWIESPEAAGEPPRLCCIFYDKAGKKAAFINRNEFYTRATDIDISTTASRISLRVTNEEFLRIDVASDRPLTVMRMSNHYGGIPFEWDATKTPGLRFGTSAIGGVSGAITVRGGPAIMCGLPLRMPVPGVNRQELAGRVAKDGAPLRNFRGDLLGWRLGAQLVDVNYQFAGFVRGDAAYGLTGDYAGRLWGEFITHAEPSFDDGEPIYIEGASGAERGTLPPGYDTAYKVFGLHPQSLRPGFILMG